MLIVRVILIAFGLYFFGALCAVFYNWYIKKYKKMGGIEWPKCFSPVFMVTFLFSVFLSWIISDKAMDSFYKTVVRKSAGNWFHRFL